MELLLEPEKKATYEKCKYKVKYWEHYFKKKHGRLPSKLDIREADREIRLAYKTYFDLKSAALEQSFQDIDGFDSDEDVSTTATPNAGSEISSKDEEISSTQSVDQTDTPNTENTWGSHLNNTVETIEQEKVAKKPNFNTTFTQKLFKNSSFSKRNPRKSLSFRHAKSETISNTSKSLSQPMISSNVEKENEMGSSFHEPATFKIFETVKMTTVSEQVQSKSLNAAQSILDDKFRCSRNLDIGWMERVALSSGTKFANESINGDNFGVSQKMNLQNDDDSDDIIEDSDNEDETSCNLHIVKKRKMCGETETSRNVEFSNLTNAKLDFSNIFSSVGQNNCVNEAVKEQNNFKSTQGTINDSTNVHNSGTKANMEDTKTTQENEVAECPKAVTIAGKGNGKKMIKTVTKADSKDPTVTRTSTRKKKTVYQLEPDSEPETPFENLEDNDPEYQPVEPKPETFNFEDTDEAPKTAKPKEKVPKRAKKSTKGKKNVTDEKSETVEDDAYDTYELEYSVKPRIITVPRNANLKNVIRKATKPKVSVDGKTGVQEPGDTGVKGKRQQDLEKLKKKIESGNLNDNFVRIDLRKKIYARGKKTINFSKFKKNAWKQRKKNNAMAGPDMNMGGCDGGMLTCFNCGQVGHFAQKCTADKGDKLLSLSAAEEEQRPFPTLEEASQMAKESQLAIRKPVMTAAESIENCNGDDNPPEGPITPSCDNIFEDNSDDELFAEALKLEEYVKKLDMQQYLDDSRNIKPYYEVNEDGSIIDTPLEVTEALRMFGHTSFRPGQEKAIMRILSGQSTLVTLSTGSGKSLCYQLPAFLYARREPCISLIISPLVSLMEDQVTGIPEFLKAACLHTNKTKVQREKILEAIGKGSLDVLLVSPEAIVAGEKSTGFGSLLRKLPPVAFACIDEAHCVSQWSHNFRPSYLMICRILKERLGIQTILGLTATATRATSDSIINHLSIPDGQAGVISDIPLPDNLRLTVSKDANKDQALIGLLVSKRFEDLKSIIVYCTRRQECTRIASLLRTYLQSMQPTEVGGKKRKRSNVNAEAYHAGICGSSRRAIQRRFMSGELRIVVATVAFGMGINKSDIRAVIHYNLPKNFESYVQEVGRAGRDGLPAYCHLFLDANGNDVCELQRHVYSDSIERHVIRKLLQKIFVPCSCKQTCPKHEVAFSIEDTVRLLDLPEENIVTLLCYLELHEQRYIEVLSQAYTKCKLIAYGSVNVIKNAAKDCPPLAMALAMFAKKDEMLSTFEFPIVDVAAAMGWDSGICKHKLKNLEWIAENNQPKRSLLTVQFTDLGFRLLAPGNLSDEQLDEALDSLNRRVINQEHTSLLQLHSLHDTVSSVVAPTYRTCITDDASEKELALKTRIREYFNSLEPLSLTKIKERTYDENLIANDTRAIVSMYRDNTFTGRAVARIFYGIPSPNYPAVIWGRCKFWRAHIRADFNWICSIATREILKMK